MWVFTAALAYCVIDALVGSANILRRSAGAAVWIGFALTVVLGATLVDAGYCSASLNRFSENC